MSGLSLGLGFEARGVGGRGSVLLALGRLLYPVVGGSG